VAGFVVYFVPLAIIAIAIVLLRLAMRRYGSSDGWRRGAWLGLGNLLVLVALLACVFLTAETYYRFFYDTTDGPDLSRASQAWFHRHYRSNEAGFRDNIEYATVPKEGKRRVSFLGDSFSAGHGISDVNDRFANLVRRQLAPHEEVHCLAINGLDTAHQRDLLEDLFGVGYRTDLVVLVYCANDLSDLIPDLPEQGARIKARVESIGWLRNSYAIDMWHSRWVMSHDPDAIRYFPDLAAAYDGPLWEQQVERVRALREVCRRNNTEFALVIFPFMLAAEADEFAPVYDKVATLCLTEGIPSLDLRPALDAHADETLMVSKHDAHPNERAHAIAAEAITAWLRANLLKSPPDSPGQ